MLYHPSTSWLPGELLLRLVVIDYPHAGSQCLGCPYRMGLFVLPGDRWVSVCPRCAAERIERLRIAGVGIPGPQQALAALRQFGPTDAVPAEVIIGNLDGEARWEVAAQQRRHDDLEGVDWDRMTERLVEEKMRGMNWRRRVLSGEG